MTRSRPGVVLIPTRLSWLIPQVRDALLLDHIKVLLLRYNRATGRNLILGEALAGGWCANCQTYLEAGQRCGCRK